MGVLTVLLKNITNLADEDHIGKSDPYVKFELEQDNLVFDKDYGERKRVCSLFVLASDVDARRSISCLLPLRFLTPGEKVSSKKKDEGKNKLVLCFYRRLVG